MPSKPVSRKQRKRHESLLMSAKQAKRVKRDGTGAESSPEDYTVTDAEAGRIRRAIEDRAEEQALERALRPGWED